MMTSVFHGMVPDEPVLALGTSLIRAELRLHPPTPPNLPNMNGDTCPSLNLDKKENISIDREYQVV